MNLRNCTTAGLLCALPWTAIAADAMQSSKQNRSTGHSGSNYVKVVSATDLLDADIETSDGKEAGEIEYLLIDGYSGKAKYVMIGEDDELELEDGEYVAVPFSTLNLKRMNGDDVHLSLTLDELERAPKFTDENLSLLTDSQAVTRVVDYFYPIIQRGSDTEASAAAAGTDQKNTQSEQSSQNAMPDSNSSETAEDRAHVLVSRQLITTVLPGMNLASDYVGAEVRSDNDDDIGNIDQIVIEVESGEVAYFLVSHGGFLGIGEEWYAMPPKTLTWNAEMEAFVAAVDSMEQLNELDAVQKERIPARIRRSDLEALDRAFGVDQTETASTDSDDASSQRGNAS